jgi:hypothetical protein
MIERDPRLPAPAASALHGESVVDVKAEAVAEVVQALGLELEKPAKAADDRRGRRPAWLMAMITIGVAVGIIAIVFIKFVNGPVSSGAIASTPTPTTRPAAVKSGLSELSGINFDMSYPAAFDQISSMKPDPQMVEQYYISSKAEYSRSLAVSVREWAAGVADEDASYRFRALHPDVYTERRDKMNGLPLILMFKKDKTEATMFWAHNGKLLTVAVVSTKPTDSVEDFMKVIESNIRWKS